MPVVLPVLAQRVRSLEHPLSAWLLAPCDAGCLRATSPSPLMFVAPTTHARPPQVDNPAAIKVGEYYDILYTDVDGKFNNLM